MEFRQLFTFKKIVEMQSFTQAAESLGYSQPTVTSHIQALEEELRVRLFDRIGRRIALTDAGEELLTYVNQMAGLYQQIESMADRSGQVRGSITIGASETVAAYGLEMVLAEYRRLFPAVHLTVVNDSNGPILDKLNRGEIDLAFQLGDVGDTAEYETIHLAKERFVLVAHRDCAISAKDFSRREDGILHTCVLYNAKGCIYRAALEAYLESRGLTPAHTLEFWSTEGIKRAALNGLGIAMLPMLVVRKELEEKKLKMVDVEIPESNISVQLIHHKNKWLSAAMGAWIEVTQRTWGQEN